jgi:uroporphyrin-III C-methyltransferase/precorrin-2 dehydrogenase/sirohydrochlorin ferrochelatase
VDHLPVFLDLHDRAVLLVGGGEVAARKAALLASAGARVRIVAPALCAQLADLRERHGWEYLPTTFEPAHFDGVVLAIAATDHPEVNLAVSRAGAAARVFVNAVDDPAASSCLMPAIIDRSPVIIAVGSSGAAPTLARRVRAQLEALLPERLGALARQAGHWRAQVRAALPDVQARRRFWDAFFDSALAQQLLHGSATGSQLEAGLSAALGAAGGGPSPGCVWLIGAGPGDPDLLTLRAQQLLQQCDVVLHDRLVPAAVLERVRRDAERICVGKQPGGERTTQAHIHELMISLARRGLRVARLKGGDPMVFARGGEELAALLAAGIPVLVVPGVTAALGAAAAALVPLTHRGVAQSVCFVTVSGEAAAELDWRSLASALQTVVFYMGAAAVPTIASRLVAHGAPGHRPAAIIEQATLPAQRVIVGTLADIAARAAAAGVAAPALLIVGDVARYARAGGSVPEPVSSH